MDEFVWRLIWKFYSTGQEAMGRTTLRSYLRSGIDGTYHGKRIGMRLFGVLKNSL